MNNNRFLQLGWILFAAITAVLLAGGFQGNSEKVGVVDVAQVIENSDYGKAGQATFTQMKSARESLLEFISNNRVLTTEQATGIRDLILKTQRTKEEDAKLESLKADVVAQNKKWQALAVKPDMSVEDRTLVEDYAKRAQTMDKLAHDWLTDFTNEMQTWADKQKIASIAKAKVAIQQVAKAQSYTVVFEASVAPYGANDISEPVLTAMNAGK